MKSFTCLTIIVLTAIPLPAKADTADLLACELQSQSAAVAREVYYHFRGTPQYVSIYLQSLELYRHAELLHRQVDAHADEGELCKTLECMRPMFQRIDRQIEAWEHAQANVRLDVHGHAFPAAGPQAGYVSPFHLQRLCGQLTAMKATMDQIDGLLHPGAVDVTPLPPPPGATPRLPPPPEAGSPTVLPRQTFPPQTVPRNQQPRFEAPLPQSPDLGPQFPQQSHRPAIQFNRKGIAFSVVIK